MRPEIVSEKRHIELAAMDVRARQQFFQVRLQAFSEPRASGLKADQVGLGKSWCSISW